LAAEFFGPQYLCRVDLLAADRAPPPVIDADFARGDFRTLGWRVLHDLAGAVDGLPALLDQCHDESAVLADIGTIDAP
jgi:hypothetical protein